MSYTVVLTADRGSFSDYAGNNALGYVACMPYRLVPRIMMDKLFTPPMKAHSNGEAVLAPYALRKVEAILYSSGIKGVAVSPPEQLYRTIGENTKVVGLTVHDPYGFSPVSTKITMLFGGGDAWNAEFFSEISETIRDLKKKYGFKVIAGGPGVWQFSLKKPDYVDAIFNGEAEIDMPNVVRKMIEGDDFPRITKGKDPKVDQIPTIIKPSRFGEVQVTRGCPRGCQFCSITPETFRSIPLDAISREIQLNLDHGVRHTDLITDDILLYGSKKLRTNHDEVVKLFSTVKDLGMEEIYFPHVSAPAVRESPETIYDIGNIAEYYRYRAESPVVGLESGSVRILDKYMRGKAFPWEPKEWGDIIIDSAGIMNDAYITPVYTMTIGFDDETNADVEESIKLVENIIDSGVRAWVFPLPVIPITTSRIRGKSFPELERLPDLYWTLLYISWKHDINITRKMFPYLSSRTNNVLIRSLVNTISERTFSNLERIFRAFMETKGRKAYDYSSISLEGPGGIVRTMMMFGKIAVKRSIASRKGARTTA